MPTRITAGFWEPHTSSIDFCESNYVHSSHIVELHNTWSSLLGISLFGLIGIVWANPLRVYGEHRWTLAYAILILIGIGSAGLHGSLHWIFQSSDELPMVYLATSILYLALEYNAPLQQQAAPNYPYLPSIFTALMVLNTVVYYCFQHIYGVFLVTYATEVTVLTILTWRIGRSRSIQEHVSKRLGVLAAFSYLFIGAPVWVLDMLHCHRVVLPYAHRLPGIWEGATPHVIWHFAAGFGAYCCIVALYCARLEELKMPFYVQMLGGVVPIIGLPQEKKFE